MECGLCRVAKPLAGAVGRRRKGAPTYGGWLESRAARTRTNLPNDSRENDLCRFKVTNSVVGYRRWGGAREERKEWKQGKWDRPTGNEMGGEERKGRRRGDRRGRLRRFGWLGWADEMNDFPYGAAGRGGRLHRYFAKGGLAGARAGIGGPPDRG